MATDSQRYVVYALSDPDELEGVVRYIGMSGQFSTRRGYHLGCSDRHGCQELQRWMFSLNQRGISPRCVKLVELRGPEAKCAAQVAEKALIQVAVNGEFGHLLLNRQYNPRLIGKRATAQPFVIVKTL